MSERERGGGRARKGKMDIEKKRKRGTEIKRERRAIREIDEIDRVIESESEREGEKGP